MQLALIRTTAQLSLATTTANEQRLSAYAMLPFIIFAIFLHHQFLFAFVVSVFFFVISIFFLCYLKSYAT